MKERFYRAKKNLAVVLGREPCVRDIFLCFLNHFFYNFDIALFSLSPDISRIKVEGVEFFERLLSKRRFICFSAHVGVPEIAYFSVRHLKFLPGVFLERLHGVQGKLFNTVRKRIGLMPIYSVSSSIEFLKDESQERRVLTLISDRYPAGFRGSKEKVVLFGREAFLPTTPVRIAQLCGSGISLLPFVCIRKFGRFGYNFSVRFFEPIEPDKELFVQQIEKIIMSAPHQWQAFWNIFVG